MEVILLENIMNLGNIGDKVVVKPGYGRNYLLKTGKALRFNKENLEYISKKKDELNRKNLELKKKLKETAKIINNKSLIFNKESKENGELYGSIKPKEISTLIFEKMKVEVNNLTKKFNNTEVVKNITFLIEKNKTLGLLGPNGCGKTTSIGMMLGLIRPTSGSVFIDGKDINKSEKRITTALKASKENNNILIFARTDALNVGSIKASVKRAIMFNKLGAHAVFITGINTLREIKLIKQNWKRIPLIINITQDIKFNISDINISDF